MGDVGFFEKTDSRRDEGILGGSEGADKKENEEETAVFSMQQQQPTSNFDLNLHPVEEDFVNSLFNFDSEFPEMQTENPTQSETVVFGVDLKRTEENPDVEIIGSSSSKKRRLLAKEMDEIVWKDKKFDFNLGLGEFLKRGGGEAGKKRNYIMGGSKDMNSDTIDHGVEDAYMSKMEDFYIARKKEESRRHQVLKSPFGMALEMIRTRNSRPIARKKSSNGGLVEEFKWVPKSDKGSSFVAPRVPSLLDLSMHTLAKNADAMVSLDHVPDMLRHKLSQLVCDSRKMDAHFLELLARGSPTEIRVKDGSQVTEDEFTKIFGSCDTKNLIVLQLDLCGSCMSDYVLQDTLARSPKSLPALVTLSLNGAYRLTDKGLNALAMSAPALHSINLSQCSLLTSAGINNLAIFFKSTLRELYLDECHNVEAMVVLPALRKLKCLEVLSLAGIQTVCDDFIIGMLEACGKNIKELVLANCVELTDVSLRIVGKNCSRLCAIDLSYLRKLTDSSMRYLANGCRSINRLKLCRNSFSDEAIAAFLEASGGSLTELSLNNVTLVGLNTALSLAKCSRKLFSLDLSWCRNLTDEALGLIVDSCLSLRLLKLFGCTQITEVFLSGHSNAQVEIIGLKMTMVSKYLNMHEHHEAPLRYSTINRFG
ncbi:Leucine-rich repeat, cysteine-containing subtype [Corchorus olitorius]|uniref:Leucine-rich repeat, cysteine-containing subtype n=1 Tax=Corchorus olitorius TaxID=93759 RepID=A0A1R3IV77_9ROSI|nr:Leucine-rich repeat, cysteine-containing subtype [Corchorus olitorius]